jgi:transposase-like protein
MENALNFNEEIKKCKTQDDLFGEDGLIKKSVKEALESMLQAEIENYLGRKKHQRIEDTSQTT